MMMQWRTKFPVLATIKNEKLSAEIDRYRITHISEGEHVFCEGDTCKGYMLVVKGVIRVYRMDTEGREILLYRVQAGENCMLTTTCLLGSQTYPAQGLVEDDVEVVFLPAKLFESLLIDSIPFRREVMSSISRCICDMMLLIEDVAFGRMDQRVATLLLKRADKEGDTLLCTHQEIAAELGTAREVVSRILKDFEARGWVALSRGSIVLSERSLLGQVANIVSM
jgi:CRP/FNR family transcriptional regulator